MTQHRRKYYDDRRERFMPNGMPKYVRIYDNGGPDVEGGSIDRYTVVFVGHYGQPPGRTNILAMNAAPFHPQGFGQHGEYETGFDTNNGWSIPIGRKNHLGTRIAFDVLPDDCKKLTVQDYEYYWDLRPHDEYTNPLPLLEK